MKVQIKNGAILLPKKIMKSIHLPENGECEVELKQEEIRIFRPAPTPKAMLELLKKPRHAVSIKDIIKFSEPEID